MNACIKDYEGAETVERMTDEQLRERERREWLRQKYPRLSEDEEPNDGDPEYDDLPESNEPGMEYPIEY